MTKITEDILKQRSEETITLTEEQREQRRQALKRMMGLNKHREGGPVDSVAWQRAERAEWDERELDQYKGHPTPEHLIDVEINRELRRIQETLGQPTITVPDNLTREEARALIIKHASDK